jgi:hypothetical protein
MSDNLLIMRKPAPTTADGETITIDRRLFADLTRLLSLLAEQRPHDIEERIDLVRIIARLSCVLSAVFEKERP